MQNPTYLKVLIIRFSSIGDIVLTTPVVRCLSGLNGKNVEVHYATKKGFAPFLKSNPYVSKVHVYDGNLSKLVAVLKAEKFDFVIDLHNNLRSTLVKLALGRPSRAFNKLNFQKWILTRWKIDRLPKVHIVDRYLKAAAPLNVINDGKGLDYFIPAEACNFPENIPSAFRNGFAAFVIGGMHATKRLPNEKISEICRKLNKPVILLGGPDDAANAALIQKMSGEKVFNACGILTLHQSAFLVKQSAVVITHDTGLMHIAAAFNKPVISVWGNTVPEFGMYPYMPENSRNSHIVGINDLRCRPCSKIGYEKCPLGHFKCMQLHDENHIAALATRYF